MAETRVDLEYVDALAEVKSGIATVNLSDAQIGRRLNWTVQEISNLFRVENMLRSITLVAAHTTGLVSLDGPSTETMLDADIIYATWEDTGYKLELLTSAQLANWNASQVSGDPRYFVRLSTWSADPETIAPIVQIFPPPNSTDYPTGGNVNFLLRMSPVNWETGKYCPLPSRFHRAVILGTKYMCLSDVNDTEQATITYKQYQGALQAIRDREAEEFIHTSQGVAVVR